MPDIISNRGTNGATSHIQREYFIDWIFSTFRFLPKVSAGQESQELQIARRYRAQFDEIFVQTQAPSPAVKDDREFAAFFNILRWFHPDAGRIRTKEYASLKASTLIVYFILPPFFSRSTERFACKV